jgi:hypothetical protein
MFIPVALLTGRVYQDGLGGLRAVLFGFLDGPLALLPFAAEARSLQVRAHNLNEFVGRESLLGIQLLGVDDVKADVAFEQFGH